MGKHRGFFLAIGFIGVIGFFSLQARAASQGCRLVNLYDAPNRPFDRIPIYDQGEMSTCYAFTASQMIDFLRFKRDPAAVRLTSPLWTALIHKVNVPIHWNPDSLDFSRMTWVFKSLNRHGICDPAVVDRAVEQLKNGNDALSESDLMFFFQTLWDDYQTHYLSPAGNEAAYELAYEKVASLPDFVGKIHHSLIDKFRFMTRYSKGERLKTLMREVFSECVGEHLLPIGLPNWKSLGLGFASNRKLTRRIDQVLDSGRPLGMGYCSELLEKGPGYRGIQVWPRVLGMALNQKHCDAHYSILVGKRPSEQGKCEYLIRNTYGTGFWTDHFSCLCASKDSKLPGYQECQASTAKGKNLTVLGCWVGEDDLASNIFDLAYFTE